MREKISAYRVVAHSALSNASPERKHILRNTEKKHQKKYQFCRNVASCLGQIYLKSDTFNHRCARQLFLVNDMQTSRTPPLPPSQNWRKLGFWYKKMRNVLKRMKKQFSVLFFR